MKKSFTFSLLCLISLCTFTIHPMKSLADIKKCKVYFQLLEACQKENFEEFVSLAKDADINDLGFFGYTILHAAASFGKLSIVEHLVLGKKALVNIADKEKKHTPLHYAIINNHLDIIEFLIQHGANSKTPCNLDSEKPGYYEPLLCYAVKKNNFPLVQLLIKHKAQIDAKNKHGNTPLHFAAFHGHADIAEYLLDNKASIESTNNNGNTPLQIAVFCGHVNIVKYLLNNTPQPANTNPKTGLRTPLWFAIISPDYKCKIDKLEVIKLLLKNKANTETLHNTLSKADPDYYETPLCYAARNNDVDLVLQLMQYSANVEAKDKDGSTPLHLAVLNGHVHLVQYLLDNDDQVASTDPTNNKGYTPLQMAVLLGKIRCAKHLLHHISQQAHTNPQTKPQRLLWIAIISTHYKRPTDKLEMIKLLLENKIDTEITYNTLSKLDPDYYETPLCYAARTNNLKLLQILIKYGANVNTEDALESTPLHLAVFNGHVEIAQYLLNNEHQAASTQIRNNKGQIPLESALTIQKSESKEKIIRKLEIAQLISQQSTDTPAMYKSYNMALELALKINAPKFIAYFLEEKYRRKPIPAKPVQKRKKRKAPKALLADIDLEDIELEIPLTLEQALRDALSLSSNELFRAPQDDREEEKYSMPIDKHGNNLLHRAVIARSQDIVKYLIERQNFNIEAKNNYRKNALHLAIQHGQIEIINYLFQNDHNKANIEAKINGKTPLCFAITNRNIQNRLEVIKCLLNNGANIKNSFLSLTYKNGHFAIFKLLVKNSTSNFFFTFKNNHDNTKEANLLLDVQWFKYERPLFLNKKKSIKSQVNEILSSRKHLDIYIPLAVKTIMKKTIKKSTMSKETLQAIGDLRDAVQQNKITEETIHEAFDGVRGVHKKISSEDLTQFLTNIRLGKQRSPQAPVYTSLDHGYRALQKYGAKQNTYCFLIAKSAYGT